MNERWRPERNAEQGGGGGGSGSGDPGTHGTGSPSSSSSTLPASAGQAATPAPAGGGGGTGGGAGVDASLTTLVQRAAAGDAAVAELGTVKAELAALAAERDALRASASEAVGKYRETRAAALPEAARTLVAGDTIAAIDASVAAASELVTKIAAEAPGMHGAGGAFARRVPVGGGDRQPVNTEGMTATEMIRAGVAAVAAGGR